MNTRKELEKAVLGAVILENCYMVVQNILSSKNFTGNERIIMQVIESVFPDVPIDTVLLAHQLRKINKPELIYDMGVCQMNVNSCHNVVSHALVLLQSDIKEKALSILQNLYSKQDLEVDKVKVLEKKAFINQVIDSLSEADILTILPGSVKFLRSCQISCSDLEELAESIPKKASKIKEVNSIKVLCDYWKSLVMKIPTRHANDLAILLNYFEKILIAGMKDEDYRHIAEALLKEPLSVEI